MIKNALTGITLALTGALLLQTATAAEKTDATAKPQETRDKVSYSIGVDIGSNFKRGDLDLNVDFLVKGIQDAYADKVVMSEEEMKETLMKFQDELREKMMAKMKAEAEKNKAESDKFLEANKKQEGVQTTESGLQYKIIKKGDGPKPTASDVVALNYVGTLPNGHVFDKNPEDQPAIFPVEGIIPGFSEALKLMPVGSKWQIVIPPDLAYGENVPPGASFGPNQALVFEVELLEIKKPEPKAEEAPAAPADKK